MQLKRHSFMLIIGALSFFLTSCVKKTALDRAYRSDADSFFAKPTLKDYKRMESLEGCSVSSHKTPELASINKRAGVPLKVPRRTEGAGNLLGSLEHSEQKNHLLLDIPLPVDARVCAGHADFITPADQWLMRSTSLVQSALVDFYVSMLESAGWSLSGQMQSPREWVMLWEKPRKFCVVSLRPMKPRWHFGKNVAKTCIIIAGGDKKP